VQQLPAEPHRRLLPRAAGSRRIRYRVRRVRPARGAVPGRRGCTAVWAEGGRWRGGRPAGGDPPDGAAVVLR